MRKQFFQLTVSIVLFSAACSKSDDNSDDDDDNGGGNNDPASITSISPEYVFWGDQLTVNGTGFSSTKTDNFVWLLSDNDCGTSQQDSTDWKKAEVISASATKLVIKVPFTTHNNWPCGPDLGASLRVTVKGKPTVISPQGVRTMGCPVPISFCSSYGGGYHAATAMRPGDSVLMRFGGAGMINLHNTGNQSTIRLSIGTKVIPVKVRPGITGCGTYGVTFVLPVVDFALADCSPIDPSFGQAGGMRPFKLYIEGHEPLQITKDFFVTNLPNGASTGASGPTVLSKSAGGNPFWTVTGKNMYYYKVSFTAQAPCSGTSGEISTVCNSFCDEFNFNIPLSLLNAGCTYGVRLIDRCGQAKLIGSVSIIN